MKGSYHSKYEEGVLHHRRYIIDAIHDLISMLKTNQLDEVAIQSQLSSLSSLHQSTRIMTLSFPPLDTALQLFATVRDTTNFVVESTAKPVVTLYVSQELDRKQKHELQQLLVPIMFLFRGRDDITLVQLPSSEITHPSLAVFKDGTEVVNVTTGCELKDRINKLVAQIGWSSDCPDETQVDNYLLPINAEELLGDVVAFTVATGQRDYIANAANVSSIIWHAFVEAGRQINWAGFYFVRPLANPKETDHDQVLILGPFMGKPACSRIRYQTGVCGASWRTKSVQRITDVHEFSGHIACDDASASELVVPVFSKQGDVIAVIDLDCPQKNGFSAEDERTFVEVARVMADACDWDNVKVPYTQP